MFCSSFREARDQSRCCYCISSHLRPIRGSSLSESSVQRTIKRFLRKSAVYLVSASCTRLAVFEPVMHTRRHIVCLSRLCLNPNITPVLTPTSLPCVPIRNSLSAGRHMQRWLQYFRFPWKEPTDDIKNYFGEKIGLYHLWLGHYTTWCGLRRKQTPIGSTHDT